MRKIPSTMMSQHPDNSMTPYWHTSPYVPTQYETHECYLAFSEMGVNEFKWDWEGKLVDEAVIERLFQSYFEYFQKHPIGKDKFLTFRLPNPYVENEYRLARAFMSMYGAAGLARTIGVHSPPLFEVILPMTDSAKSMIEVQRAYDEIAKLKHPLLRRDNINLEYVNLIPLFEDIDTIMNSADILEEYLRMHNHIFEHEPEYLRPYVARSDPALNAGIVPTVLAIKIALSNYSKFSDKSGILTFPIIGSASLPFRGSLRPTDVDRFIDEYRGVKTALIQSAFRYDYPLEQVKAALKQLDIRLPQESPLIIEEKEIKSIKKIIKIFADFYQSTIENIADDVNAMARFIPKRRERVQHIGLFGYSRGVGKVTLPRAISFTGSMYSLGVPPDSGA